MGKNSRTPAGPPGPGVRPGNRGSPTPPDRLDQYRTLFEHASDGVYLETLEGRILDVNPSGARMLGYEPQELVGKDVRDIVPPRVAGSLEKIATELRRRKALTIEAENVRKDGRAIPVEVGLSLVEESGEPLVVAVVRDISERKKTEKALRESEGRFRSLVENAPDFIGMVDRDGTIRFVNRTVAGLDPEKVIGTPVYEYAPREDHEKVRTALERVFEKGEGQRYESAGTGPDGTTAWYSIYLSPVESAGEVVGAILIARDITDRKRVEEEMKVKDRAIESSINAIAIGDSQGRLTYVNPSFLRMWGFESREEILGRSALEFWQDPEVVAGIIDQLQSKQRWIGELPAKRADGATFDAQVSASLVRDKEGRALCLMGSFADVTERKRAELALRASEEKYRAIARSIPDAICRASKGGTILDVRMAGKLASLPSPSQLIGTDLYRALDQMEEVVPKETTALCRHLVDRALGTGTTQIFETPLVLEGKPHDYEIRIVASGEEEVLMIARDITLRKRAEQSIRESEAKFRAITENSLTGIAMAQDGKVVYANKSYAQMFGCEAEEVLGVDLLKLVAPGDRAMIASRARKRIRGEAVPRRYEFRGLKKDGTEIDVEVISGPAIELDGRPTIIAAMQDVTDRKRAEKALSESEEKYRTLVEQSLQGLVIAQGMPPRIVFANPALADILGYTVEELLSLSPEKTRGLVHPKDREMFFQRFQDRLPGKPTPSRYELRAVRRDGSVRWVEVSASRVDYRGKPAVQATFVDITERRKAEKALQESEERFRSVFENTMLGLYRTTPAGRVLMANPALVHKLGYASFEELRRRNLEEEGYEPAYPRCQFKDQIDKADEVVGIESAWLRRDGTTLFVRESARAIRDEAGKVLYYEGAVEDITERKLAEEALRESEEKYRLLVSGSPSGVIIAQDERLAFVNARGVDLLGYESDEDLVRKHMLDPVFPEDREKVRAAYERDLAHPPPTPVLLEHRLERRDGSIVYVESVGSTISWDGKPALQVVFADVSERVKARELTDYYHRMDERLATIAARFIHPGNLDEAVTETLADVGAIMNIDEIHLARLSQDGRMLDVAHHWQRKGRFRRPPRADLASMRWLSARLQRNEAVSVSDLEELPSAERALYSDRGTHALLALPVFAAGELRGVFSLMSQSAGRRWDPGEVRFARSVSESIARALERASAEAEKARLQEKILQSQKMEAIALLARGIAQDFRDALFTITGSATLLRRKLVEQNISTANIERIEQSGQRMSQLVDQLYTYAIGILPEPRRVQPNQCLEQATLAVSDLLPRGVTIEKALSPRLPTVLADPASLERVFTNILTNAAEAVPEGGGIRIRTEVVTQAPFSGAGESGTRLGPWVHTHIADTGCGMSPDVLAHLFEPYASTKFVGRGWGMAVAHWVVKGYRGILFVDSEPGRGTNVHVYLPTEGELERPPKERKRPKKGG